MHSARSPYPVVSGEGLPNPPPPDADPLDADPLLDAAPSREQNDTQV